MEKEKDKDREKNGEKRDPVRFWGGVLGASALGLAVVAAVIVQGQAPRTQTAARTQAPAKAQTPTKTQASAEAPTKAAAPARVAAAVRTEPAPKPQVVAKAEAAVKPPAAPRPLSDAERKLSEELWVEQKKLEKHARVTAATPEGRRRVAGTIARQLGVPEKLVDDLRSRKVAYGEITVALALSQPLMKRDKVTRQRAVDSILELRKAGQGWAAISRDLGLTLTTALAAVKRADQQLATTDAGTAKTRRG
jgi:hypothetical protein